MTNRAKVQRKAETTRSPGRAVPLAAAVITLTIGLVYANSLSGVFVYDDVPAIPGNGSLRHFFTAWHPPDGSTVSGRPFLNVSFALNYAVSGTRVWSYHLLNIIIHASAAVTLFGIFRRTLLLPTWRDFFNRDATVIACCGALAWGLHPLQTEAVDYLVQRTEALMGLCYFLALYMFQRMTMGPLSFWWGFGSVAVCAIGMATKEVMVSAPLMILFYDYLFLAQGWMKAVRSRWRYYLFLAGTWGVLVYSLLSTGGNRNGTKGFNIGVPWIAYAETQIAALSHYLALTIWPSRLAFNYAPFWVTHFSQLFLPIVALAVAGGAATIASRRQPKVAYGAIWVLVLLAPASLVPGTGQMIVEHRMYLALAGIVLPLAGWSYGLGRRGMIFLVTPILLALGARTAARNLDYRGEISLWNSSVEAQPEDPISQCNLGIALAKAGYLPDAISHYTSALSLAPHYPEAHYNLGIAFARSGQSELAVAQYREAILERPVFPAAHANLALLAMQNSRFSEAVAEYRISLDQANDPDIRGALANALYQSGAVPEAVREYTTALREQPDNAEIHYNYGTTLLQLENYAEAVQQYRATLAFTPADADSHFNLALAYVGMGQLPRAEAELETTLGLRPTYVGAREQLQKLQNLRN